MSEFMDGLSKAAETAKETVGKGVDFAKLKWAILRLQGELEDSYTALGKYLSDHRDELSEENCLQKITALYEKIDKQKSDLALLKAAKPGGGSAKPTCAGCGATLQEGDAFCPKCGKKREADEKEGV